MADIDQLFPSLKPVRGRSNVLTPMVSPTSPTRDGDRVGVPLKLHLPREADQWELFPERRTTVQKPKRVIRKTVVIDGVAYSPTAAAALSRTLEEQAELDARRHMAESSARGGGD